MTIYISGLEDMPTSVRRYGVRHLVSIIQDQFQPPTPAGIAPARHHRCRIHDIVRARPGEVLADADHVRELIGFLRTWRGDSPLLVHCFAGVSRSTAAALIAHVLHTNDPLRSAAALRAAAPYAWPNRRIVKLADALLGFGGKLDAARESMGEALFEEKVPGGVATLRLTE